MRATYIIIFISFIIWGHLGVANHVIAQEVRPTSAAELFFAPQSGTFQEGSTFEVPVFINTKGNSINAIELSIRFDPRKLAIVDPSGGKSVIGLWVQPPSYDNTKGVVSIIGGIPGGLTTTSGLIVTLTFKVIGTGTSYVSIADTSKVLLNDGQGKALDYKVNRAAYTFIPKPPEGVTIFSETHPFQEQWYNNKNPVFTWNTEEDVTGFSVSFDNMPNTVPEAKITTTDPIYPAKETGDGIWYVHVRAIKRGVWGNTSHFATRIDTTPPAEFTPIANYLSALLASRSLITFATTDALSGIDHYEVGVLDLSDPNTESPAFFETESPYQLPLTNIKKARVIVRAFDRAGNIRDSAIQIDPNYYPVLDYIKQHPSLIGIVAIFLLILLIPIRHMLGRHPISRIGRALKKSR
jgi:hypothetical protein